LKFRAGLFFEQDSKKWFVHCSRESWTCPQNGHLTGNLSRLNITFGRVSGWRGYFLEIRLAGAYRMSSASPVTLTHIHAFLLFAAVISVAFGFLGRSQPNDPVKYILWSFFHFLVDRLVGCAITLK
jgi:hypothetical protein